MHEQKKLSIPGSLARSLLPQKRQSRKPAEFAIRMGAP
jgi:hypothetical protein